MNYIQFPQVIVVDVIHFVFIWFLSFVFCFLVQEVLCDQIENNSMQNIMIKEGKLSIRKTVISKTYKKSNTPLIRKKLYVPRKFLSII